MKTTFQINNDPKKRTLINKGFKAFANNQYKTALRYFSDALLLDKDDLGARIGLLLADIASDFPREAHGFCEFYQAMLVANPRSARTKVQKQILELIDSFDSGLNNMSGAINEEDTIRVESIDGILYEDFKKMSLKQGFKEAFENLMFSSKIVFTGKRDFYDFLELLVENDYCEMSINYIENIQNIYFYDVKINKILEKAIKKQSENTKRD